MTRTALESWYAQTYEPRELIVLDDVELPACAHPPAGVRYMRTRPMSIGERRNYAAAMAAGEIIVHWDSDDWSAPQRIEDQVHRLMTTGAQVTGYHSVVFLDPARRRAWLYRAHAGYAVGASLCYLHSWWRQHQFPPMMVGEDNAFVHAAQHVIATADGERMLVCRIHAGNTSCKQPQAGGRWSELPWPV